MLHSEARRSRFTSFRERRVAPLMRNRLPHARGSGRNELRGSAAREKLGWPMSFGAARWPQRAAQTLIVKRPPVSRGPLPFFYPAISYGPVYLAR